MNWLNVRFGIWVRNPVPLFVFPLSFPFHFPFFVLFHISAPLSIFLSFPFYFSTLQHFSLSFLFYSVPPPISLHFFLLRLISHFSSIRFFFSLLLFPSFPPFPPIFQIFTWHLLDVPFIARQRTRPTARTHRGFFYENSETTSEITVRKKESKRQEEGAIFHLIDDMIIWLKQPVLQSPRPTRNAKKLVCNVPHSNFTEFTWIILFIFAINVVINL